VNGLNRKLPVVGGKKSKGDCKEEKVQWETELQRGRHPVTPRFGAENLTKNWNILPKARRRMS